MIILCNSLQFDFQIALYFLQCIKSKYYHKKRQDVMSSSSSTEVISARFLAKISCNKVIQAFQGSNENKALISWETVLNYALSFSVYPSCPPNTKR